MTDDRGAMEVDANGSELPQAVVKRRRLKASAIWLVPLLAALVGLSLAINNWLQHGPQITISFQTAEGLEPAKTQVKYKNVVIGMVKKIRLSSDRSHVLVDVDLEKSAKGFATKGTRYWVVRPRIGLGGVSGIDTLLSGSFIGADVGDSDDSQQNFSGLETPPPVNRRAPGSSFVLHSTDLGSLDIGSPVYYRRIEVGRVSSYQLDKNGKGVSLQIFIDGPNDKFVTRSTRFWNASGVDVTLGANGLKMNTESLATVLAGGVAFQDPPGPDDNTSAQAGSEFELFADQPAAMAPLDGAPRYIRMRFNQSARGLATDAPVEFLGINLGKVVSVNLDYDEKTQKFPVVVGALVYPKRLGAAYQKLETLAQVHGESADLSQLLGRMVDHGLRAQARVGNLLTGQLYIAFDFLPKAPKVQFDEHAKPLTLPTAPGSLDKLQEQAADIVDKIDKIPFESIGKNLNQSLSNLSATLKQVNGKTLPQVSDTLKGVQKTANTAGDALSSDSPLLQGLAGTLDELQRMARSLRVLSDYLGDHPEALIRGRRPDAKPAATPPAPSAADRTQRNKP